MKVSPIKEGRLQKLREIQTSVNALQAWTSKEEAPVKEEVLREVRRLRQFQCCQNWGDFEEALHATDVFPFSSEQDS